MREINRVYFGEAGTNEGKTRQPLQHEVMNQSFQTDMKTSWGSIYRRDGKWGQTKTIPSATWGHETTTSNGAMHPHHPTIPHTPYISFSVKKTYTSWRCLNGLGTLKEFGLRHRVPVYPRQRPKKKKRRSRREYAIYPRAQCRQWRLEP